jgi:hypothetical protein
LAWQHCYKIPQCQKAKKPRLQSVVTVSPEGVSATAVESKEEARVLASKKTLKVDFQEAS